MQREQDKRKERYMRYFERMRSRSASGVVCGSVFAGSFRKYRFVDPDGHFAFPFRMRKACAADRPVPNKLGEYQMTFRGGSPPLTEKSCRRNM